MPLTGSVTPHPLLLFAPGAGAPSTSSWMQAWAERLGGIGEVVRFDYTYMRQGRRTPDRLPALVEAHRAALQAARGDPARPTVLMGKSMGGRIGCHLALSETVQALVCFGYPLRSAGKSGRRRDQVLRDLTTPILFIQGTRDPLCPLDELEALRPQLAAPNQLFVVAGGNHSLELTQRDLRAVGKTQEDVDREITSAVAAFVDAALRGDPVG